MNEDFDFDAAVRDFYASVAPADSTHARTRVSALLAAARPARPSRRFDVRLNPTRALAGLGLLAALAIVAGLLLRQSAPGPGPVASGSGAPVPHPTVSHSPSDQRGKFIPTGSMLSPEGSATVLQDGRVLFTGGMNGGAEIYDPRSGIFSATGKPIAGSGLETATLLQDGRVLFVGGGDPLAGPAQIYDPAKGTFSTTGSLNTPRFGHTATLLSDGRVLIAGGWIGSVSSGLGPTASPAALVMSVREYREPGVSADGVLSATLASTEIYDPKTGRFTTGPNLEESRHGAAAVRLRDGTVLITGGENVASLGGTEQVLASSELFDPDTGQFRTTGPLSRGRVDAAATLLGDGRVLVSGGFTAGLEVGPPDVLPLEVYDPAKATFAEGPNLASSYGTAALLHDGHVLIAGGYSWESGAAASHASAPSRYFADCQIYDPTTGNLTAGPTMGTGRMSPLAVTLDDGRVLVAGGQGGDQSGPLMSAELYLPDAADSAPSPSPALTSEDPRGQFVSIESMLWPETKATLLKDGRVLLTGARAEIYDPRTGTFSATGRPLVNAGGLAVWGTATLLADGRVLFAGGVEEGKAMMATQIYDPATGTFSPTGRLARPQLNFSATLLADGRVLIAGGWDPGNVKDNGPSAIASTQLYDPATGKFSNGPDMTTPRYSPGAVRLPDGRVLIAGGANSDGMDARSLASAELFDPASGSFRATGSLSMARARPWLTPLADGRVLASGGLGGGQYGGPLEVFDPAAGTFSQTGLDLENDGAVPAVLGDGRVLFVGGWDALPGPTGPARSCQLYDPQTNRLIDAASMSVGRQGPSVVTLADGRILVAGGTGEDASGYSTSAEMYVPAGARPAPSPDATTSAAPTLGAGRSLGVGYQPSFSWSPDGRWLAVVDYRKPGQTSPRVRLFDDQGGLFRTFDGGSMLNWLDQTRFLLFQSGVTYLGSVTDEKLTTAENFPALAGRFVSLSSGRGAVGFRDDISGKQILWSPEATKTVDAEFLAGWSHDGTKLLVLRDSKAEDAYGKKLLHLEVLRWPQLDTIATLPDGEVMFNGFDPSDRYILILPCSLYDLQTGSMIRAPGDACPTQEDSQITWYRDGMLAHASHGEVTQYSMSWEPIATVQGLNSLARISPCRDGSTVLFWKPEGLGSLAVLRHGAMRSLVLPEQAGDAELSPDGSRLVVILGLDPDQSHQMLLYSIP